METKDGAPHAPQVEMMLPGWSPRQSEQSGRTPRAPTARLPRITRLMALAIKFQDMVSRGEVRDYADLARLGYVTRARITQIMNLLNLAPNIQEEILSCKRDSPGIQERQLRSVTSQVLWQDQRRLWSRISPSRSLSTSATASEIHSG
jgi:hypothetical protein